ncbi:MAG: acetylglutamate kinase [Chloroflexota bacterium]
MITDLHFSLTSLAGEQALPAALERLSALVGRYVVVKLGGSAMPHRQTVLQDIACLRRLGINLVLVHGGGAAITEWLNRIGKQAVFVNGLRVTDPETMEIAQMVLVGKVNQELVALLNHAGVKALGLSGIDGALLRAQRKQSVPDIGLVGEVHEVDALLLQALCAQGYVPVIAPIGLGPDGEALNINADTVAGDVARALEADVVLFLTDVEGVRGADGRVLARLTPRQVAQLRADGVITGGMIPKVDACLHALHGTARVYIADGRRPHAILLQLATDVQFGTSFIHEQAREP